MAQKNNPRKCIVTQKVMDKQFLIRVVKLKTGEILINSNAQGRGAYISKSVNPELVIKKRVLDRVFRTKVSKEAYEELTKVLEGE